jgi:hypothetical protein
LTIVEIASLGKGQRQFDVVTPSLPRQMAAQNRLDINLTHGGWFLTPTRF